MNTDLAAIYGTPGAEGAYQEDLEKAAEAEMFAKLAAEANIDLNELTDAQVQELYEKVAQETCPKCEKAKGDCSCESKGEEKEAAAQAEFAAQQEWNEKVAEADYLGRVMAHSMTQELGSIEDAMQKEAKGMQFGQKAKRVGELLTGSKARKLESAQQAGISKAQKAKATGEALKSPAGKARAGEIQAAGQEAAAKAGRGAKAEGKAVLKARLGAGGAAALSAGGYAATRNKESSAIDELAAEAAVIKAAEAGWDFDEAFERIDAVQTLGGPGESEKIAYASNTEEAVELRSLEYLEGAGYPVEWD